MNRIVAFQDCTFDLNNVASYGLQITDSAGTLNSFSIERCTIKNTIGQTFIRNDKLTASKPIISVKASVIYSYSGFLDVNKPASVYVYNNSFGPVTTNYPISFASSTNTVDIRNNIFYSTAVNGGTIQFNDTAAADIVNSPANYTIKNNVFWDTNRTSASLDTIIGGTNYLIPMDTTNYFFNPNFTSVSTGDLSINATPAQWISGKGNLSVRPQLDRNGQAWTGNDVGAYKLPSAVAPTYSAGPSVGFVGDSIMHGSEATTGNDESSQFTAYTGISNIGTANGGVSGLQVGGVRHWIDYVATTYTPATMFFSIGVNNLNLSGVRSPANMTDQQLATEIEASIQRIINWGITPVWLGVESVPNDQSHPDAVNALVQTWAQANGVRYGSILDQMRFNSNWNLQAESGGYYGCTSSANCAGVGATLATNVHPNNAGHAVIANLAEYLYYTNHTIGTDGVDIQAGARIYSNGKFRDTGNTSGSKADLTATPSSGVFIIGNYSRWLDISNLTWNTSGTYSKQWTASSTIATTTVFTIGDLQPLHYYSVSVDSVRQQTLQAGANGKISYTYSGGWSTHTFNVSADATGPLAFSPASPANGATGNSTQTFSWNATTDGESGLAKYQLYVDGALVQDNITGTTFSPASGYSCGSHTWYVQAVDNAGNGTNSDTYSFSVACGGGPLFTGPASSLPGYVAPRLQMITDGKVTYLDEKVSAPETTPVTLVISVTPSTTPAFIRPLKRGAKGTDVSLLQTFLKKDPTFYPEGLVTGFFGPATERAIRRFQEKYGIASLSTPGYGTVGPKTRAKLNTLIGG